MLHRRTLAVLLLGTASVAQIPVARHNGDRAIWVGTTDGTIRVFELRANGKLRLRGQTTGPKRLRFLAFHPRLPLTYGSVGKRVQVYRIDDRGIPKAGASRDAGLGGTHIEVDPGGAFVFLASYGGGAVLAFPLDAKGVPGPVSFDLRSPKELCRKAHQVRAHPNGRFVYAPCLGDDVVQILTVEAQRVGWLGRVRLARGSGPRHLDFDPSGTHMYVLNERASSIYVYRIDAGSGALTEIQALSALPAGRDEGSRSSDIHVSLDGRFVYAIHREPLDQIVSFSVRKDGGLRTIGRTPTGGTHSRSFALSDDGGFVVIGHSKTRNVVVRRVDTKNGLVGPITDEQKVEAAAIFVGLRR